MTGLFIDKSISPFGIVGDFNKIISTYHISFQWTLDGIRGESDCEPCRIVTEAGESFDFCAGSFLSWQQISGNWTISHPQGRRLCEGETIRIESVTQWMEWSSYFTIPQSLVAIDRLIAGQAFEGTLTCDELFQVRCFVEEAVNQGKVGADEAYRWMMRWYDCFRMLSIRKMDSPVPDPRAVHWLQAFFKP